MKLLTWSIKSLKIVYIVNHWLQCHHKVYILIDICSLLNYCARFCKKTSCLDLLRSLCSILVSDWLWALWCHHPCPIFKPVEHNWVDCHLTTCRKTVYVQFCLTVHRLVQATKTNARLKVNVYLFVSPRKFANIKSQFLMNNVSHIRVINTVSVWQSSRWGSEAVARAIHAYIIIRQVNWMFKMSRLITTIIHACFSL